MPYDIYAVKKGEETLIGDGWPARGYAAASASKWAIDSQLDAEPVEVFHVREQKTKKLVVIVTQESIRYL